MTPQVRLAADAAEGLRFEHDLFSADGPQVGLWASVAPGIVCPRRFERTNGFAAACKALSAQGWPVLLRTTEGGAVPQGAGVVNLALSYNAPARFTIEDGYRLLIGALQEGLRSTQITVSPDATPGSFCNGGWNLSIKGKKFIGTTERWRPDASKGPRVLAHALILTEETFQPGTDAVSEFHRNFGLSEINRAAHTSLAAATDITELPADALYDAAMRACQFQTDKTK